MKKVKIGVLGREKRKIEKEHRSATSHLVIGHLVKKNRFQLFVEWEVSELEGTKLLGGEMR